MRNRRFICIVFFFLFHIHFNRDSQAIYKWVIISLKRATARITSSFAVLRSPMLPIVTSVNIVFSVFMLRFYVPDWYSSSFFSPIHLIPPATMFSVYLAHFYWYLMRSHQNMCAPFYRKPIPNATRQHKNAIIACRSSGKKEQFSVNQSTTRQLIHCVNIEVEIVLNCLLTVVWLTSYALRMSHWRFEKSQTLINVLISNRKQK